MVISEIKPVFIEKTWNELKTSLKAKINILTYADGKKEEMLASLQIRLGKTKEELALVIAAL